MLRDSEGFQSTFQGLDENSIQNGSVLKFFRPSHQLWRRVPDYKWPVSEQKEYSVL